MASVTKDQVFKRHQKVVAAVDLPGVPAGTPGRVLYVAGLTWIRYHVAFDNGRVLSSLDATQLMAREDWERKQYEERLAARRAASGSVAA
ncbi:MAG: hypothetical protein WHS89_04275 [Acidimicrobiales bacterium]